MEDSIEYIIYVTCAIIIGALAIIQLRKGSKGYMHSVSVESGDGDKDVVLLNVPSNLKLQIITVLHSVTNLGLSEIKFISEHTPYTIIKNVHEEKANNIKRELEQAGAIVEIRDGNRNNQW